MPSLSIHYTHDGTITQHSKHQLTQLLFFHPQHFQYSWDIHILYYIFTYMSKRIQVNTPLGGSPCTPYMHKHLEAQQEAQDQLKFHRNCRISCRIQVLTNHSLCIISDVARRILERKAPRYLWKN